MLSPAGLPYAARQRPAGPSFLARERSFTQITYLCLQQQGPGITD